MPYAQIDDHEIAFLDVGGEGPPIMLVPGPDSTATSLRERFEVFGTIYRLIAWDPPVLVGEAGDRVREHARLGLELLHHQGIERAIFAGDAAGALVAVRAGLLAPDRVRGLMLFDLPTADAAEFRRIEELDIPTLVVHAPTAEQADDHVRALAAGIRDNRGVHLLDGEVPSLAADRAATLDPILREYLESLPA